MKIPVFFLLMILSFSVFLGAVDFSSAIVAASGFKVSPDEPIATYTGGGNLLADDVDYWWISGVNQGEQVLVSIQISPSDWWTSVIYYSNLTEVPSQNIWSIGTHIHQFVASKTGNYLLRISGYYDSSFNYTIDSNHPIAEQSMYIRSGNLPADDVDYWWISSVNQGNQVLVDIQISPADNWWTSVIYYSNLTEVPSQNIWSLHTHMHQFVADKTDTYLLRIIGEFGVSLNYTMESTHPIAEQSMYTKSAIHNADSVNYHALSGVGKGNQVLVDIQISPADNWWTSVIYYSNLTEVPSQNIWSLHTHMHQFVADKTDTYLLRITSGSSFNYTIESTHRIDAGQRNATQISFVIFPNPTNVGQTVTLQGSLTSNGTPIPTAQVKLKLSGNQVGTLTTNATGWFKASGSVGSAGTFNITVEYPGSEQYLPSANWTILVVMEPTRIYCRITPNPVDSGSNYTYEGILVNGYSQPLAGATIQIYNRTLTGSWKYMTSVTTNNYGIFRWQGTAQVAGTFLFAAYYAGSTTREPSYNYAALIVQ